MSDERDLPPLMASQGGVVFNHKHIDYWRARALAAEQAKPTRAQHEALMAIREAARRLASRASDVVTTDSMGTRFRTIYHHHLVALQAALRAAGIDLEEKR